MVSEQKTEIVPLDLRVAKHYARMNVLRGERDPDSVRGQKRITWLHKELLAGRFHSPAWATVTVKEEKNKQYRVDGGHSSQMLAWVADKDFPEGLSVIVRHFKADTRLDAQLLYERFNRRGSMRTFSDLVKNRAAYQRTLDGLSPTIIGNAARGISRYYQFYNDPEECEPLQYIIKYQKFIRWTGEFIGVRRMNKVGFVAAMFATYKKDPVAADEFWAMVRDGVAADPNCPTRRLANFMRDIDNVKNASERWTIQALYTKSLHAWNAWRTGARTSLKVVKKAPLPEPK